MNAFFHIHKEQFMPINVSRYSVISHEVDSVIKSNTKWLHMF